MPLFQAKIGWKMPGKREYENYRSVLFQPDAKQEIPKKQQKKVQKIKKYHYGFLSSQNRLEKAEKERI